MVTQIDIEAESVLFWIDRQDDPQPTPEIVSKFSNMKESRVRSKLDTMRKYGLVKTYDKDEYSGASKNTNYYQTTNLVEQYKQQYGLTVPRFEMRAKNIEWVEYQEEHLEVYEKRCQDLKNQNKAQANRIRRLEQKNKELEKENKKQNNRIEQLEEEVFDDTD